MKTEFTHDGLMISAQDLSGISPVSDDHDRMFHHDGSSEISMVGGGTTSQRGYYVWDSDLNSWYPLFHNADKLDGKEAGDFLQRDGSLPMQADLDLSHNGLIDVDSLKSGVGEVLLNANHLKINSLSGGSNVQLNDSNNLLLLDAQEGGDVDVPNGALNEQGSRVATRTWTNANADVPNADYADNANNLDGYDESAFLHVSGDQMEGTLDLGSNNVEDGTDVLWNAVNSEVPKASLGGPSSSLTSYPLPAGDLAEDYAVTSRFPLPASDLAESYALTSRFPLPAGDLAEDYAVTSRFPIPNTDIANSDVTVTAGNQLTGGGSVSLGGTITVDVDENNLDADTLDGSEKADLDSQYVDESGDTMSGSLTLGGILDVSTNDVQDGTTTVWDTSVGEVPQAVLGGPAASLNGYPLQNSDLNNSTVTVTAGNQLTGGGSVGLGGSITVDVDENALDADTLDGAHKSDLDSQYVDASGDTMTGAITWTPGNRPVMERDPAGHNTETNGIFEFQNVDTGSRDGWFGFYDGGGIQIVNQKDGAEVHVGSSITLSGSTNSTGNLSESGNRVATRAWTEANADVPNADYADNAGDSDTLDGEHASAFADSGHLHDSRYLLESGDTLSGALTLSDGSKAASQSWVNSNADVPNADHADSADDSNTLEGLDSTQFLRSDSSDTLNSTLSVSGETKVQFGGSNYHVRYDSTRDTLVIGSAENGETMEVDNAGNLKIEGSLTEGATIGS
jgi:hypothetical protein